MGTKFASGKKAFGFCDLCGFRYKLKQLKSLVRKGVDTNIKACPSCWNGDHPQNKLGEFPVYDPQALRDARPDRSLGVGAKVSARGIQWGYNPVGGPSDSLASNALVATGEVGQVTVTIT